MHSATGEPETEETIHLLNPLKEIVEGDSLLEDIPSASSPLENSLFEVSKTTALTGELEVLKPKKRNLGSVLRAPVRIEGEARSRGASGSAGGRTLDSNLGEKEKAEQLPQLRKEGEGGLGTKPGQMQQLKKFGHLTRS